MNGRTRAVIVVAAIAVSFAGCSDQDGNIYLHFTNATGSAIEIVVLYPDTNTEFVIQPDVQPGTTSTTRSDIYPATSCSDRGILIARDTAGREVARRTGRICKGDIWVVGGSGQPSSHTAR